MIDVIDSGLGNIQSVVNMISRAGGEARIVSEPERLVGRDKIILPGVGAYDEGITRLRERGFDSALHDAVNRGAWLIGVCLGMQLLFDESEEGELPGLGMVPGGVRRFQVENQGLKVPHMGWNVVYPARTSKLFPTTDEEYRYYFVHSYYAECQYSDDVIAVSRHGIEFTCAVQRNNVLGVQFHPEKSHRFGMDLLKRFVEV